MGGITGESFGNFGEERAFDGDKIIGTVASCIVNSVADDPVKITEQQMITKMEEGNWYPTDVNDDFIDRKQHNTPFYNGRQMIVRMHNNCSFEFEDAYGVDIYDELRIFSNGLIEEIAAQWGKVVWEDVTRSTSDNNYQHEKYWEKVLGSFKEKLKSFGDADSKVFEIGKQSWETVTKHSV
ncbi:MAG: hypothetical protein WCK98_05845 [bacterium]